MTRHDIILYFILSTGVPDHQQAWASCLSDTYFACYSSSSVCERVCVKLTLSTNLHVHLDHKISNKCEMWWNFRIRMTNISTFANPDLLNIVHTVLLVDGTAGLNGNCNKSKIFRLITISIFWIAATCGTRFRSL